MVLRAHVRNGQIVLDEPATLEEGATLYVVARSHDEPDLAELDRVLQESVDDFENGRFEDAREFAARLVAKS